MSSGDRVFISKDVLFDDDRFPYSDLFPQSPDTIKNVDQYFTLFPNLSFLIQPTSPVSNTSTLSDNESSPHDSPSVSVLNNSMPSVSDPAHAPVLNTHRMQTRSKSVIFQHRIHPSLLLSHSEPTSVKQALRLKTGRLQCNKNMML